MYVATQRAPRCCCLEEDITTCVVRLAIVHTYVIVLGFLSSSQEISTM